MLKISNLWFRYSSSEDWVLKNINLSFSENGLYIVSGPSGSGKSTLARIIAGVIPYLYKGEIRGTIELDGVKYDILEGNRILSEKVAFLGQQPELYAFASTVKREIIRSLELVSESIQDLEKRLKRIVELFELGDILDSPLTELSAGQMQKVELAALIARDPEVILLDEPLSRLDPPSKKMISKLLISLSVSRLVIVFEHDLENLLSYAKSCIVIDKGEVKAVGEPREIIQYMNGVDLPLITELFLMLRENLNSDLRTLPLNIEEALELLREMM